MEKTYLKRWLRPLLHWWRTLPIDKQIPKFQSKMNFKKDISWFRNDREAYINLTLKLTKITNSMEKKLLRALEVSLGDKEIGGDTILRRREANVWAQHWTLNQAFLWGHFWFTAARESTELKQKVEFLLEWKKWGRNDWKLRKKSWKGRRHRWEPQNLHTKLSHILYDSKKPNRNISEAACCWRDRDWH